MKEVETDMREAAVRYFEGCLSAQDEERLYRFIQESGGNYSLFKEWERQWLETSVAMKGLNSNGRSCKQDCIPGKR